MMIYVYSATLIGSTGVMAVGAVTGLPLLLGVGLAGYLASAVGFGKELRA